MTSKDVPITEARHRNTESPRISSEERYRLLVENSYDVVYSVRPDGVITYVSPQIRNFGHAPDDMISTHFLQYVAPEQRDEVIEKFNAGTATGENFLTEFQLVGKDGRRYWVETVGKTAFDDNGGPVLQTGVMRDITERKRAEEALRGAAELLERRVEERTADLRKHLLFEQLLTDLSARFIDLPPDDIDWGIEFGLKRILDLFDLDRCGFFKADQGENSIYLTHLALKEGVDPVPKGVNLALYFPWIARGVLSGEIVSINTDDMPPEAAKDRASAGEIAKFRYGLNIPLLLHGRVSYMIGMTVERTEKVPGDEFVHRLRLMGEVFVSTLERIRAVRSLSESEAKYRIVADFTHDWEYWANPDGTLQYVSPSAERVSGYTAREFIDHPPLYRDIIIKEDRKVWDRHYSKSWRDQGPHEIRFRIRRKDGDIRWIEHVCLPVTDKTGAFLGFRANNRDITQRKKAEQKLKDALSEISRLTMQLEAESAYLQEEIKLEHNFQNIIGTSDTLKYVLYRVEQVASTDAAVMILGETGTGKELIARAVHDAGPRSQRPLIKVNCAALPVHLIESELFGHEKGAFTGASSRRIGRFELADGATLFLDEIGELPLELQGKLLRVLEHGEFERLGNSGTIKTDVRIIAASNRDLEAEAEKGAFRRDLWYRLNVFSISLPPLRDRAGDIPLLAVHFLETYSRKHGRRIETISQRTMKALQAYPWPGNVRELANIIERGVISSAGDKLELPLPVGAAAEHVETPDELKPLVQVEREAILRAVEKTRWRINGPKGAAKILGLKPSTLRSRMQKLGIRKP